MKHLIKKELCFSALPLTYYFILFACMTMIPGYPILVGAFFVCMGIFQTFQSAREQNDILYTVLMPVRKKDAVTARYFFVMLIQMIFFLICVLLTVIRMQFLAQEVVYQKNAMMNANPAYLGYVLIIFTAFNVIFVNGFWKNAYTIGKPFLRFSIAAFLIIGLTETLHHIPGLMFLNSAGQGMYIQMMILLASVLGYSLLSWNCLTASQRNFEKTDL